VRIDESRAAPLFSLVAKPNDWAKKAHSETSTVTLGPKQQAYLQFWDALIERIRQERPGWTNSVRGSAQSWMTLPFGSSSIWYGMAFTQQGLCVELYFGSSDADENKASFGKYASLQPQIESDFGGVLSFQPLPEKKACRIAVYLAGADVTNTDEHTMYSDWLMTTFESFRSAMESAKPMVQS